MPAPAARLRLRTASSVGAVSSAAAVAAGAATVPAVPSGLEGAVADAVATAGATAVPQWNIGPAFTNSTGTYPDYSVTVPTIAGEGWSDFILSWFQTPMYWLHDYAAVPWWAAIGLATLALRVGTARLYFGSLRGAARMQMHSEEVADYQRRMKAAQAKGDQAALGDVVTEFRAFMKAKQLPSPLTFVKNILLQMPLYVASFFAVKRLARDAHLVPGFATGGSSWFTALHIPDPTFTLPIASLFMSWLSIWTNPNVVGIPQAELSAAGQRLLFTVLGGVFSVVAMKMPAVSSSESCC